MNREEMVNYIKENLKQSVFDKYNGEWNTPIHIDSVVFEDWNDEDLNDLVITIKDDYIAWLEGLAKEKGQITITKMYMEEE